MDLSGWVVGVAGVVDPAALDHQEEALLAVLRSRTQGSHGCPGHLVKRRVDVVLVPSVDLVRNIRVGEEAKHRELHGAAQVEPVEIGAAVNVVEAKFLLRQRDNVLIVLATRAVGGVGQEVAAATAEHEVHDTAERVVTDHLLGNTVLLRAHVDVSSEAGGRGIGNARGDDQAGHVASLLGRLQHGAASRVVGQHGDGAVVALEAARESRGSSGRVRHQAARRAGPRLADKVAVQDQRVVPRLGVLVLLEATGQGQRRRPHAVRHHEDEVALALGRRAGRLGRGLLLVHHRQHDNHGRGNHSPCEQADFPPLLPAVPGLFVVLAGALTGE